MAKQNFHEKNNFWWKAISEQNKKKYTMDPG